MMKTSLRKIKYLIRLTNGFENYSQKNQFYNYQIHCIEDRKKKPLPIFLKQQSQFRWN